MIFSQRAHRSLIFPMSILYLFANGASAAGITPSASVYSVPTPPSRKLSAEQLDEVNARVKIANSIADHVAADAQAKGLASAWRIGLLASLYKLSSMQLQNIEPIATTLDQAHVLANSAHGPAQTSSVIAKDLGSATDNLVFTPTTPCRFIDTRVTGGAISAPRDFDTLLDGSSYGGDPGCTLPRLGEPAFAANVTVVIGAGAAGYIGIRPFGTSNTTSFLNWPSGGAPSGLANSGIITTGLDSSSHYEFEIFNGGTTNPQVIMDYFGYFAPATYPATAFVCSHTSSTYATVYAGANNHIIPTPACNAGYTAVSSYCLGTGGGMYLAGSGDSFCSFTNTGSSNATVAVSAVCCQVPAISP